MNNKKFIKLYYEILEDDELNLFEKVIYSILDSYCDMYRFVLHQIQDLQNRLILVKKQYKEL